MDELSIAVLFSVKRKALNWIVFYRNEGEETIKVGDAEMMVVNIIHSSGSHSVVAANCRVFQFSGLRGSLHPSCQIIDLGIDVCDEELYLKLSRNKPLCKQGRLVSSLN